MGIITIYSCRKNEVDDSRPNNNNTYVNTSSFSASSVSDAEIIAFLDNFDQDTVDTDSIAEIRDIDMRESVYLVEGALNVWLRDFSMEPDETDYLEFNSSIEFTIDASGDTIVDSLDIISLYSEIYDESVFRAINNTTFENTSLDIFIRAIRIHVNGNLIEDNIMELDVTLYVSNELEEFETLDCEFDEYWMAGANAGGCSTNMATGTDAAKILKLHLNANCNNTTRCNNTAGYKIAFKNVLPNSGILRNDYFPYPNFWRAPNCFSPINACLSPSSMLTYFNEVNSVAASENPKPSTHDVSNLNFRYMVLNGPNCTPDHLHTLIVEWGQCYLVPYLHTQHPPDLN